MPVIICRRSGEPDDAKRYTRRDPLPYVKSTTEEATSDPQSEDLYGSNVGPAVLASLGSVGLALYYYYVRGEKQRGQFIGLWPATILGLAVYLKVAELTRLIDRSRD